MKKAIWAVALMALGTGTWAFGLDERVNLSGTWILDKEKSDPVGMRGFGPRGRGREGGGPAPANIDLTVVIEQGENELKVVRKIKLDERERSVEQRFTFDGQETVNPAAMGRGEMKSKTNWKKDKLLIEGFQTVSTPNGDFELGVKEEFSLSPDAQVLTIRTTRASARGENTSKQVFNKQP